MTILGTYLYFCRPLHLVEDSGHRQATLFGHRHTLAREDLGIDEHKGLVALLGNIDDEHSQLHIDLRGRESDPRRGIHRLEQVIDQQAELGVETRDRQGPGAQARVGEFQDRSQAHDSGFSGVFGFEWPPRGSFGVAAKIAISREPRLPLPGP